MPNAKTVKSRAIIGVPDSFVEDVAQRAADILEERMEIKNEGWIGVEQAASHLGCSKHRIYRLVSFRRVPYVKDGPRVLFKRSELDAWLSNGGAEIQ